MTHLSSAHRTSDVRIHLREAASLAAAGYAVCVVANRHQVDLPATGVALIGLRPRPRWQRATIGTVLAVREALQTKPLLIHIHDPELVWAIPLLRMLGKIVIYDAHEDLPVQVVGKPYIPKPLRPSALILAKLLVKVAGWRSHCVIAATDTISRRFPPEKVVVVRNYPRLRPTDSELLPLTSRPLNVAYLGVMSLDRGMSQMVDSFASSAFPSGWNAVLAGSTSPDSLVDQMKARPGWERVDFRGFLSTDAARDLLHECRVGLVLLQRSQAYLDSLPTKMFEYFAAGLPVIASDFPLWREIIETYDCGLLVDETSPDSIASAVTRYAEDPDLLERHGQNARRAATQALNWGSEEAALLSAYARVTNRNVDGRRTRTWARRHDA